MSAGWPAQLVAGRVGLRPLRRRDRRAWREVRRANEDWLRPWEATPMGAPILSWEQRHEAGTFTATLRQQRTQARAGTHLPFGLFVGAELAGQVTIGSIVRGAFDSGYVGYWVDHRRAGQGVVPTALALVADHCFRVVGLHRLEANIRPENAASLRVVDKLGFSYEGRRRAYLAIDGDWRDHLGYVLLATDHPEGVLARWQARQHDEAAP